MPTKFAEKNSFTSPANRKNKPLGGKLSGGASLAALAAGLALGGGVLSAPSAYALAGIVATGNGPGPLTVSAPALVTESNGDGIKATNYGTDLTVTATDVSGSQDGIDARNYGTGELSVTSTGTVTGSTFDGINVLNYYASNGNVNIDVADVTGETSGIFARNYGAGSIYITSSGDVTGITGSGIAAQHMYNSGTDLVITTTGAVSGGSRGIDVQHGGTGILSITSTGDVTGAGSRGISAVNSQTSDDITITAANVSGVTHGIFATNQGSGSLSVTSNGAVTGLTGIRAGNTSSAAGDVAISAASVVGQVDGIFAFNGGSGTMTVSATGPVTGVGGIGIRAEQNNVNATGNLTISVADVTGGIYGISAVHDGTGALSVTSSGAGVTGGTDGIRVVHNGTGALSVTSSGVVNGSTGMGISALSASNSIGDQTILVDSVNGGLNAIENFNYGTGAVSVTATGSVSGGEYGILSYNYATGTDLTISVLNASGGFSGISARNTGTGALSVSSTGTISGGLDGLFALLWTSGTDLTISAASVTGSNVGINARSEGQGTLSVTTSGAISGGTGAGIQTTSNAGGAVAITLLSTSSVSSTSGVAIEDREGDAVVTINAGAVVNGSISLGDGNDTLNIMAGTSLAGVTSLNGGLGSFVDTLNLNAGLAGTLSEWEILNVNTAGGDFSITGAISNIGVLTKSGAGTLTLTGNNSFIGGTTISAGSLIGDSQSFGDGDIVNNASLVLNQTTDASFALVISGTGSLTKSGAGALTLTGVNSFSGGTTISAGRLIGNTQSFGTGAIVNNASLVFNQTSNASFASVISGTGSLTKTGGGVLTLTGINSFTGGTTISSGRLIGNSQSFGSGAIVNNASLELAQTTDASFASVISGTGSLTKSGAGALTLTGVNSFSGGTTISAGRLIGNTQSFGTGAIVNNASLVFNQTTDASFASVISGTGSLTKSGAGALTLTGVNSFSGGTTISAGTLIGNSRSFGSGAIVNNAALVLNQTTDASFASVISGTGSLTKSGTGALTLTGVNSFSGGTTISAGRLIGNTQSFGTGAIVNNASLVLNQTTDASFASVISGTGSLTKSGAGALTLTGVNSFSGGTTISAGRLIGNTQSFGSGAIVNNASLELAQTTDASFASVISGSGSLTKSGAGALTLTGVNSFSGGTTISSGSLIGNTQSFGTGVILNNASLVLDQAAAGTLAAAISGTGALTKSGAGSLTLTGVNSFSGGTTISSGSLIGNSQSFGSGAIVNNASLVLDQTTDASFAALISGTGSLTKSGAGALTLTGVNSFTGGTTIASGSLIGNTQSFGSGAIVNNASLVLDQTTDASFASVISGSGSLTKSGTGALTLTGINSFSGGTTISAGTLIGNVESFGTGAIVNNASLVFDQTSDASFASVISGTGSLTKSGAGSLTLTGVNGFSGGTTISSGSLIGNTQSFGTGAIVNDASLVLNQTTDASFAGAISGTGSLTKSGAGTLTLTGVNSFTGTTTVTAGRLNLAGSLAVSTTTLQSGSSLGASGTAGSLARSALTLQSGSSLGGNGTVGTLVAQSGSTVSPGNSIGTLSVNGNLTLAAGSLLAIEVAPSGADMVTVTGTANLAGNLTITPSAGQYSFFQRFTLVSANTVTGTFANSSLGDFGSKFLPKLVYDATSVALRLDPKSLVEVSGGTLRGNALGFATAFDTAVFAGYNPDRFVNLYAQGADLAGALGQFTGERFSAERQAAMQSTHVVRDAAFAALNDDLVHAADTASESKYAGDTLTTVWMRAAGSWGTVKADGTASRYKTDQTAVLTGIDVSSGGFKLGGMVSQSSTDVNLYSFGQSNIESVGATVYAGYRGDTSGFAVGFGAGFASNSALGSRAITVPTLAQVLIGKTKSTSLQYFAEASYDFAGSANSRIEPFARIARVELDSKAFAETGGSAAVHGDKQSNSRTMAGAGIRGAHASANMTLTTSIGWQRTIGDLSAPTNLELTLIDTSYEVHSAAFDRNAVTLDTQASFRLSSHMMFGIGYNALAGKNNRSHGARATIRYAF